MEPATQPLILLIDDEPSVLRLMQRALEASGFAVLAAESGRGGLDLFHRRRPDLVLLDLGLPDQHGLDLCRQMSEESDTPVVIVTARGSDEDMVRGLEAGADDYLAKPFSPSVLVARVRAVLRRAAGGAARDAQLTSGALQMDLAAHTATLDGTKLHLTPLEFRLLEVLMHEAGRVIPASRLLTEVWGSEYVREAHILRTAIARLRRKLESDPSDPHVVLTEPGVGYRLEPPPESRGGRRP